MSSPGAKLRAARVAAGVSLSVLAERTSYAKPYLSQLETGHRTVLSQHVTAYERALGLRIDFSADVVGMTDVRLMAQATSALTALGLRHGGTAVAEMAAAQWNWASRLLANSMRDNVRRALAAEGGYLADRAAWSLADAGRADAAARLYEEALELAEEDQDLKALISIDLAEHNADRGNPQAALNILGDLTSDVPVLRFSAYAVQAHAVACTGDREGCLRFVGRADDAYAEVDLDDLPIWNRAYASGHAGHADSAAGKALHRLARLDRSVVPLAIERLERAVREFGPDRARAASRSAARLADLLR